jgi:NTE family protein
MLSYTVVGFVPLPNFHAESGIFGILSPLSGRIDSDAVDSDAVEFPFAIHPTSTLSLSGGGSYGAFQVGCLKAISEFSSVRFDSIDTISVGGLIGSYIAQYDISDQPSAIVNLHDIWLGIANSRHIYKHWKLSYIEGVLYRNGLYNPRPLKKLIDSNLDSSRLINSDVAFHSAATNVNTGEMTTFDKSHPGINDAVLAGCSIPIMFPPVKIDGESYVDAGIKRYFWSDDLEDRDKSVVVITTHYDDPDEVCGRVSQPMNFIKYGASVIRVFMESLYADDMSRYINRPNVIVIRPKRQLHGQVMNFNSGDITKNIEIGYNQTRDMIMAGEFHLV